MNLHQPHMDILQGKLFSFEGTVTLTFDFKVASDHIKQIVTTIILCTKLKGKRSREGGKSAEEAV